tara:strand:+ start:2542 stop:3186 length:645 start_codon:yes stop_codon:yes gene_type:complete
MLISKNKNVCSVVLTGGLSSRMGGGVKSLRKFNNRTIIDRIIERIIPQAKVTILNTNQNIKDFKKYKLTLVEDDLKGSLGPLAGIHAAMKWVNKNEPNIKWLMSVPSDTPFLPKNLLYKLFFLANKNKKEIILAKSNERLHPAIGLWKTNLYDDLEKNLQKGIRKIMMWVEYHSFDICNFEQDLFDPFFNVNFPKDLVVAKEIEDKYILNFKKT